MRRTQFSVALLVGMVLLATGVSPVARADQVAQWDPGIAPIAASVEQIRGLRFRHPVAVEFQDSATFDATLQRSAREFTPGEEAQLERQLAELRALGLVPPGVHAHDLYGTPDTSGILAYYVPDTEQITVRGTDLTPAHRMTIAHELTHALDDQWFDLQRMQKDAKTSSEYLAVQDLVEGDAERVELRYELGMTAQDQAMAEKELAAEASGTELGETSPADAVEIFGALESAPYLIGPPMVDTFVATHSGVALDGWFRKPPESDEPAYSPLNAARPHDRVKVTPPALRKGERRNGPIDDMGPVTLYLVLASRIDPATAAHAVDEWAGDATVPFRSDGKQCVRTTVAGHGRTGTTLLAEALRAYADQVTGGGVKVRRDAATRVTLTACDPGPRARVPAAWAARAVRALTLRNQIVSMAVVGGLGYAQAACASTKLVDDPVFDTVVRSGSALTAAEQEAVLQRFTSMERACRP